MPAVWRFDLALNEVWCRVQGLVFEPAFGGRQGVITMNRRVSPADGHRKELSDALDETDIETTRTVCPALRAAERQGGGPDRGRPTRDGLGGGDAPFEDEAGGTENRGDHELK